MTHIRDLNKKLADKEDLIKELKRGGVGVAAPPPPPDAEALLEAFQHRYSEVRYQIEQLEEQVNEAQKLHPDEIKRLKGRIDALLNREKDWIQTLSNTLESLRENHQKAARKAS